MLSVQAFVIFALGVFLGAQGSPQCQGQSCYIAYLSGSTKSVYKLPAGKTKAEGQDAKGEACTKDNLKKLNVTMPPQLSSRTALLEFITSSDEAGFQGISMPEQPVNQLTALEKRQGCKPETLLWVRGTFETGEFGNIAKFGTTVQSTFSKAGWGTIGLKDTDGYDAAASNNYCVGLPGGVACVPWLNKQVANCPNSKFILGGYSQGAMVSRICIAFASPATRAKVKGLLLYGDPMNGADNKGISSDKIKTFCNEKDGVCSGEFKISSSHLSYNSNIDAGLKWAQTAIKS